MDYNKKADEIYDLLDEIDDLIWQFPLLSEMRERKLRIKREYFARINFNLMVYGSSPLKFDDIEN